MVEGHNGTERGGETNAIESESGAPSERRHSGSAASDGDRPKADSSGGGGGYFDDDDINFDVEDLEDVLA